MSFQQILEARYSCSYFTDEATEAQRSQAACLPPSHCSLDQLQNSPLAMGTPLAAAMKPGTHSQAHRCSQPCLLLSLESGVRKGAPPVSPTISWSQSPLSTTHFFGEMEQGESGPWRVQPSGRQGVGGLGLAPSQHVAGLAPTELPSLVCQQETPRPG